MNNSLSSRKHLIWSTNEEGFKTIQVIKQEQLGTLQLYEISLEANRKSKKSLSLAEKGYKNPFNYKNCKILKNNTFIKQSTNTKWLCLLCNEMAPNKQSLINHYDKHKKETETAQHQEYVQKNIQDYYKCSACPKEFTSSKCYQLHWKHVHGESRYTCDPCKMTFRNSFQLCLHNFREHSEDKTYKCIICGYTTLDKDLLQAHVQKHENDYKFTCEICSKTFQYSRLLIAHGKSEHPEIYSDSPIVNKCEVCEKQFAHKKSLLLHLQSHKGESTELCEMCGKCLSNRQHLEKHLRTHTGYKPHGCSFCSKSFSAKEHLKEHERVHTGEKPYICKFCRRGFSQRSPLRIHQRIHTGDRPYTCRFCNKGFISKGVMDTHMKICDGIR